MSSIKFDLDQQRVINSDAKNICVIAGAGAGKTACLIARVRRLLQQGVDPAKIVCITFTTMAATEMKQRLSEFNIHNMFVGTIHSYAFQMLRRNRIYKQLLTPEREDAIARELIEKHCKHLTVDKFNEWSKMRWKKDRGRVTSQEMWSVLDALEKDELHAVMDTLDSVCIEVREGETLDQAAKRVLKEESAARTTASFPETVTSVANEQGFITFNALLDLCTNNAQIPPIEHLFVDEFQDVGVFEYRFITSLKASNRFYVGDDSQSLYAFKGSDFEYFQGLTRSPEFETHMLINNYRCSKKIVEAANEIISHIDDVIPKKCVSKASYTTNVAPIHEVGGVKKVMQYIQHINPKDYGKWFVLVRSNADAISVQRNCYYAGIPTLTFKKGAMTSEELDSAMEENAIKVLTVHTAKGLESDNVIAWANFPTEEEINGYYDGEKHDTEECRVYYVAATRAKKQLIVIHKQGKESSLQFDE